MQDSDKPRTPEMIDRAVSAEKKTDIIGNPELYDIITSNNIHGPCGRAINPNRPCTVRSVLVCNPVMYKLM